MLADVVTTITGYIPEVGKVGVAVISLIVAGKVFKWVRAAL